MNTRRWYTPAYVTTSGFTQAIGTETAWLPGAIREAREYRTAGEDDVEVFVAYRDEPAWQRLPDDAIETELNLIQARENRE